MYIFTRRTPRTLRIVPSRTRPMITRRGAKRFVNFEEVTSSNVTPDEFVKAKRVTRIVQKTGRYEDLEPVIDLARAAAVLEAAGYTVRHKPATAMFKEFLEIE